MTEGPDSEASTLPAARAADGFAAALELFAAWLDRGPRADELELLAALPGLGETSAEQPLQEAQQSLVQHLQLEVQPLASVFLHAAGAELEVAANAASLCAELAERFQQLGVPRRGAQRSDHISSLLAALAHGCAVHARCLRDGDPGRTERQLVPLRELCDLYVLSWLPALCGALQRQTGGWLPALLTTALETVCAWREPGGALLLPAEDRGRPLLSLVEQPETGLREIAAALCAPASSGMFLSRSGLASLGREQGLPAGFGPRARRLHNLLQAGRDYGRLPALLRALIEETEHWEALFGEQASTLPLLASGLERWRRRCQDSRALLGRLAEAAAPS